jgi:hypothetical protein
MGRKVVDRGMAGLKNTESFGGVDDQLTGEAYDNPLHYRLDPGWARVIPNRLVPRLHCDVLLL